MSRQKNINSSVWQAFDELRGLSDWSRNRDYVLALLFLKFVSDTHDAKQAEYARKYQGDPERVARAMSREPLLLPEVSHFRKLLAVRFSPELGDVLNRAYVALEDANAGKLQHLSRKVDFQRADLGDRSERVRRLSQMLTAVSTLDFSAETADAEAAGEMYEELLLLFSTGDRRTGGELYAPKEVTQLLARIVAPKAGERIYDPSCGSGGFLLQAAQAVGSENFALFGQEPDESAWTICRMNLLIHGLDATFIEHTNSLRQPLRDSSGELQRFDVVISKLPFSVEDWGAEALEYERGERFRWGTPPRHRGDYAYISHAVESLKRRDGRAAVVVSLGALFRGSSEGLIRRRLIEENLVDGVIALPPNLFIGTAIPAAVLLFRTGKTDESVFFIDASREFSSERNQNRLRDEDVQKILCTCGALAIRPVRRVDAPGAAQSLFHRLHEHAHIEDERIVRVDHHPALFDRRGRERPRAAAPAIRTP